MLKRISERGHRVGSAYALTTFARLQDGHAEDVEAYLERAADRRGQPVRAHRDAAHRARAALPRARAPGPEAVQDRHAPARARRLHEHDRRGAGPVPGRSCACSCPSATSGGGAASATRAATTRARSGRWVRSIQARPGLFRSAMPNATVAEVHEALALREQVIDFAVEAQGVDADDAASPLPGNASERARPPAQRAPPQAAAARTSTSRTSRATSCAATRIPRRRTCSCGSSTSRRRAR